MSQGVGDMWRSGSYLQSSRARAQFLGRVCRVNPRISETSFRAVRA